MRTIDSIIGELNRLETSDSEDMSRFADEIYDEFNERAIVLACYMNHEDIEAARGAIVALCSAVHHHDEQEVLSAIEITRSQLEKLRDIDSVRLENVL